MVLIISYAICCYCVMFLVETIVYCNFFVLLLTSSLPSMASLSPCATSTREQLHNIKLTKLTLCISLYISIYLSLSLYIYIYIYIYHVKTYFVVESPCRHMRQAPGRSRDTHIYILYICTYTYPLIFLYI